MNERGEISESYYRSQKQTIRKYLTEYFKSYEMADIDYTALNTFKTFLFDKDLSAGRVSTNFAAVRNILKYAEQTKIIKARPMFPKLKQEDNARAPFSLREYRQLRRKARELVGTTFEIRQKLDNGSSKKLRNVTITKEIGYLIGFLVYTFIRPQDIKSIQLKHLEIKSGEYGDYLWMPIPSSAILRLVSSNSLSSWRANTL
jgi:integrase